MAGKNDDQVRCSFCNKTQNQVRKLIAGPNGAYICDECVDVCAEIIEEEFEYENGREWNPFSDINLLKPEEAYQVLQATLIEVSTNLNQGIAQVKETQMDMKKVNQEVKKEMQR